jgi:HEAT repeat protein
VLPRGIETWLAPCAFAALLLAVLCFLAILVQHRIGMAIALHVQRRRRVLLPLVLRSLDDPESVSELKGSLRRFDERIVRDILMKLAMDLREQDADKVARLCERLGLIQREIRCLYAASSRTRRRAAANLGLLRPAAAVDPLLALLEDRHINVRLAAIDALGDIGCDRGLVALIPLLAHEEPAIAWRALEALCRSGRDVGVQILRYLQKTRDASATRAAVESLRWLEPDEAVARLCRVARSERSRLRAQTARVLAAIGSERCEHALHDLLADPSCEVRAHAARGLGALGREDSVPSLRAALEDESWKVRMEATRALVELREAGITAFLEGLAEGSPEGGAAPGVPIPPRAAEAPAA